MKNRKILEDVIYVFFCYKQSAYLAQTLTSALQQTVWPSSLLILDDCSPDDSHQKIVEILTDAPEGLNIEYRHNEKNVGLVSQINSLRGKYNNKLIIVQAGDDIACPDRIEQTYQVWLDNQKPSLIIGGYDMISESSEIIRPFDPIAKKKKAYTLNNIINRKCAVDGCCAAFTSDVLNDFLPYNKDIINEDRVNVLRAYFLNGIHYEHKRLIQYRVGGISSFKKETREDKYNNTIINAQRELKDLQMNLLDAQTKKSQEAIYHIRNRIKTAEFMASLPYTYSKLYLSALSFLLRTGDYKSVLKVLRRLK